MKKIKVKILIVLTFFAFMAVGQSVINDYTGKYQYSVLDTPYGDFFGHLILRKTGQQYEGEIINGEGKKFNVNVIRVRNNTIVFKSNIEETNSILSCRFVGDSIHANVEVQGDKFLYVLKGKKINK